MKIKNLHINLLFLILGIFSLQSLEFNSFSNPNLFWETEIEETTDDIVKFDFDKQLSDYDSDSNGGSDAIISSQNFHFLSLYAKSILATKTSKDLFKKTHLFILYCCLKLDC